MHSGGTRSSLAAAYKHPTLTKYIREADLQDLSVKTIKRLLVIC